MMHNVFRSAGRRLLTVPLALAVLAGCQDGELPTGIAPAPGAFAFSQVPGNPVVNSLLDDGTGCTDAKCTLRDAITYASAGATITFDPALTTGGPAVITLTQGQLVIGQNLTVIGPGASSLTISATDSRVLMVESHVASISGLTMTRSGSAPFTGGAILNWSSLTLTGVTVYGAQSIIRGGAIYNRGALTVINSTISGNSSAAGGGIATEAAGELIITNSSISGNTALQNGGGIFIEDISEAIITNSTISGNQGGGLYNQPVEGGYNVGTLILLSSTVSANEGVGITILANTVTVRNTVIAGNTGGECFLDRGVEAIDGGYNIDAGATCAFSAASSQSNTDPKLGPLADNGGPTKTHALLPGSPAIDAGTCTDHLGANLNTDQRGFARPVGIACDMGAFEYAASPPPPPAACEGAQIRMTRTAGPDAIAPGASGSWTVKLEVTACEAVTQVTAQGGTMSWATTSAATSDGSIGVRKANKNNQVLLWEIGTMAAGEVATAVLTVTGTAGRKTACGTTLSIASDWSPTATAGGARVQYGAAGPLTVDVCEPPPPTLAAPVAGDDEYSLLAGETLNVLAAAGLLANDVLGSPAATITAVLGADGEPLGDRTILEGVVAVDPATGAFTLTGATRAGTESFQYDLTNSEGTSRAAVTITVNPAAAALMFAYVGDGQFAAPGATLLVAPAVRVTDAWDNVIAAASVTFAVSGGGGSATGLSATTTNEGIAAVGSWTLGADAGVNTLEATSTGMTPVNFTATAITSCTGGTVATAIFSAFSEPVRSTLELTDTRNVTLLVTDECGTPVPDVAVTWAATGNPFSSGDGVTGGSVTDADGQATASWTHHYTCGTRTISATVAGLSTVQHTINFGSCGGGGTPIRR